MAADGTFISNSTTSNSTTSNLPVAKRHRSIFELPGDFFDSCRLILPGDREPVEVHTDSSSLSAAESLRSSPANPNFEEAIASTDHYIEASSKSYPGSRWSCNTCKSEFDSLLDQRSHFKSDFHRINVKLNFSGKDILREEDFDESTADSFAGDFDVSSISGSEDEDDSGTHSSNNANGGLSWSVKQKLHVRLHSGERVSLWKSFVLNDSVSISHEMVDQLGGVEKDGHLSFGKEADLREKLMALVHEPRNNSRLRVVLLSSGGHFAGCVFDGSKVVAHKTFHRYVVRAKAGKKQSVKDASGKSAHSAGASLRRYNELALKKDIQELLTSWKPYFDASSSVFVYAPSNNRQLFFDGEKPLFGNHHCDVRSIPLTVRRPTFKEAKRLYNQLSQVLYEVDQKEFHNEVGMTLNIHAIENVNQQEDATVEMKVIDEACSSVCKSEEQPASSESESEFVHKSTPLHEAAKTGNAEKVLELLELGMDPSTKDERGKTPYMMATDKEVRNTFRRFMALNLDKWDWHAAKVPSALTKEMEESQAAKQAEKDAKRKAKAKELKKLHKAREKKAQAEAAQSQSLPIVVESRTAIPPVLRGEAQYHNRLLSMEEELRRKQAEEREKRAAAAERRIGAAATAATATSSKTVSTPISSSTPPTTSGEICSCCKGPLAGKIPFHRYNYKYCSTSCMHVHRQFLDNV
ncbi:hypothetical protein Dimus_006417 [Dionaea muscipula]